MSSELLTDAEPTERRTGTWAVRAVGLGKSYDLGELSSLKHTLAAAGQRLSRRPAVQHRRLRALDEVSFEVAVGEAYTILGTNGSGKTTLMSILAGVTPPTEGHADVRGRVVPVLSVGSAFHPDLTGTENAALFGTILGFRGDDITRALPEIRDFARLDPEHMATPLKRFSEGMKARLTIATALRFPGDLYVFDEVLTFADDGFKHACVAEMRGLVAAGRSVVFVSHELDLVRALCTRGLWLEGGRVRAQGDIARVTAVYEAEGVHERGG